MKLFSFRIAILSLIFSLTVSPFAFAVDPNAETAGAEQSRFEHELEQERDTRPPKKVPLDEDYIDEEGPTRTIESDVRFQLDRVVFSGNESISSEELQPAAQDYLGKEVGLQDLRDIATEAKKIYREAGFIAVYAYVPPQDIKTGSVEIAIVEGKIGEVIIEGNKWYSKKVLRRALGITLGKVLFYNDLRKGLTFLNKKKDIEAKSTLRPGADQGTTDVQIDVKDKFPIHLSTDVNNLGTRNTGFTRWAVALTHNNVFGQMDKLAGRFQLGSGVKAVGANYTLPIHETGTLLGLSYSYSKVDVGGDFKALDIEGSAHSYGINITQPIYSNEHVELLLTGGFDIKEIENRILGQLSGRDRLRIFKVGLNTEFTDRWGKTFSPHNFYFGTDGLGGSDEGSLVSRFGTGGDFFIYRGSLTRYHRLPKGMLLAMRVHTQISNDRLAPSEQLRIGGAFSVRGYGEGEYLADYGFFSANEIYIPTYFFPEDWKLPWSEKPLRRQIQGTAFIDFGVGWLRRAVVGENSKRSLVGTGIGVRIHLYDRLFARFQWATPIGSDANNASDTHFYYGISAEVL